MEVRGEPLGQLKIGLDRIMVGPWGVHFPALEDF
jgi:hypothetical protein